jgi:hypothetical protein
VSTPAAEPIPLPNPSQKDYQSPSLVDWGTLLELTAGPAFDIQDGDFVGSGQP